MHLSMISQQELRGYPMSLAVSYAVYKPHYCYLAEAHLHPLPTRLQKEQLPPHKWHSLPSSCSKIPCRTGSKFIDNTVQHISGNVTPSIPQ